MNPLELDKECVKGSLNVPPRPVGVTQVFQLSNFHECQSFLETQMQQQPLIGR